MTENLSVENLPSRDNSVPCEIYAWAIRCVAGSRTTKFSDSEGAATRIVKGTSMNIYVGNLPYTMSDGELRAAFEEFGNVASASVIKDKITGRSRGFGFVEMNDGDEGSRAIDAMNGRPLAGRPLVVNEARPRDERPRFNSRDRY